MIGLIQRSKAVNEKDERLRVDSSPPHGGSSSIHSPSDSSQGAFPSTFDHYDESYVSLLRGAVHRLEIALDRRGRQISEAKNELEGLILQEKIPNEPASKNVQGSVQPAHLVGSGSALPLSSHMHHIVSFDEVSSVATADVLSSPPSSRLNSLHDVEIFKELEGKSLGTYFFFLSYD